MYCINIKILKDLGVDPEKPSKKKKKKVLSSGKLSKLTRNRK
jgi:hypothetical protein